MSRECVSHNDDERTLNPPPSVGNSGVTNSMFDFPELMRAERPSYISDVS